MPNYKRNPGDLLNTGPLKKKYTANPFSAGASTMKKKPKKRKKATPSGKVRRRRG